MQTHEKIVYKSVKDLKMYENNPRNNDNAVESVANSIKEFGFKVPMVIDKDMVWAEGKRNLMGGAVKSKRNYECLFINEVV